MKKIIRLLAISYIIILGCSGTPALAAMSITPQPPITTTTPDIIATSIVAGAQLEHIELFNQTDVPIHVTGWQLAATSKGTGSCQVQQTVTQSLETNQWILPKHYFTFTPSQTLPAACAELTSIQLFQGKTLVQHIAVSDSTTLTTDKVYQHKQRANSPTSARN